MRSGYEESYGRSLHGVRVHRDENAAAVTGALGVNALTAGQHILFGSGQFQPHTPRGQHILGHELAHTLQHHRAPGGSGLRMSLPIASVEMEADRAAGAALRGDVAHIGGSDESDVQPAIPLIWVVAGVVLLAGGGLATYLELSGPSYEENRRRAQADRSRWINSWGISFVPLLGSTTHIVQARTRFERWFGVAMLPLDVLTLGALGSGVRMFMKGTSLWRSAAAAGGELTADAVVQMEAAGVRSAAAGEARSAIFQALEQGHAVAVSRGGTNHAEIWVRVGPNAYRRLHGGLLSRLAGSSRRVHTADTLWTAGGLAPVNTLSILRGGSEPLIAAAGTLGSGGLPFFSRSCGITQAALFERAGFGTLAPRAGRYLPINILEQIATRRTLVIVSGRQRYLWANGQLFALGLSTAGGSFVPGALRRVGGELAALNADSFPLAPPRRSASLSASAAMDTVPLSDNPSLDIDAGLPRSGAGSLGRPEPTFTAEQVASSVLEDEEPGTGSVLSLDPPVNGSPLLTEAESDSISDFRMFPSDSGSAFDLSTTPTLDLDTLETTTPTPGAGATGPGECQAEGGQTSVAGNPFEAAARRLRAAHQAARPADRDAVLLGASAYFNASLPDDSRRSGLRSALAQAGFSPSEVENIVSEL